MLKVKEDTLTFNETLQVEAWNMVCVGLSAAHDTPTPEEKITPQAYKVNNY